MARKPNTSAQTIGVLAALAAAPAGWRHGYDLSRQTGLKSGTLYPILMRLTEQGWLETRWEEAGVGGRPPRHLYRLTPDGLAETQRLLSGSAPAGQPRLRSAEAI